MSVDGPIGFVGLGAIGAPIAEALADAGHALVVCDTRPEAADAFAERGALVRATPLDVANEATTVFASLPTPAVVREVACGAAGVVGGGAIGAFVDLSTTGSSTTQTVATVLRDAGIAYLDAPVSGGVAGARARKLTVMASGDVDVFARVSPLLEAFAGHVFHVGATPGLGQIAKVLNNLLSATALAITSEAATLALRAGLDPSVLLDVLNASSGRNSATADKFPKHVLTREFASGFRLALMAKDVELCLSEARDRHVAMPVGGLVQQLWTLAAAQAGELDDHTEIVRLYERWADVTVASQEAMHARG